MTTPPACKWWAMSKVERWFKQYIKSKSVELEIYVRQCPTTGPWQQHRDQYLIMAFEADFENGVDLRGCTPAQCMLLRGVAWSLLSEHFDGLQYSVVCARVLAAQAAQNSTAQNSTARNRQPENQVNLHDEEHSTAQKSTAQNRQPENQVNLHVNLHDDPVIRDRVMIDYRRNLWETVPNGRHAPNPPQPLSDDMIRNMVVQQAGDILGMEIEPSTVAIRSWQGVLDPIADEVLQKWQEMREKKLPKLTKKLGGLVKKRQEHYERNGSCRSWLDETHADEERVERLVDDSGQCESDFQRKALIDALKVTQTLQLSLSPAAKKGGRSTSTKRSGDGDNSSTKRNGDGDNSSGAKSNPDKILSDTNINECTIVEMYSDQQIEARKGTKPGHFVPADSTLSWLQTEIR